jgi:hypothetical protein
VAVFGVQRVRDACHFCGGCLLLRLRNQEMLLASILEFIPRLLTDVGHYRIVG